MTGKSEIMETRSETSVTTNSMAGKRRSERGSGLVEYGFIVVIFLSLMFGISGFGHALFVYHHLNNAAKEATRWAAVNGHNCNVDFSCNGTAPMNNGPAKLADVLNYVKGITPNGIDPTKITISTATTPPTCGLADTAACAASTADVCTLGPSASGVAGSPYPNYPGCTVQVTVRYTYNFIVPLVHTAPITMSSTSDMVIVH